MTESKIRILYVEDNPDDQLILKRALKESMGIDYELVTVDNASKGLTKLQKETFDLLLSDYRLPDMTGIEFIYQLSKTNNKTPVILLTGKGNENVAVEAMKLGVKDYIVKEDITSKRLIESINDILLESALPKTIDIETAKAIAAIYDKTPAIQIDAVSTLTSTPKAAIPAEKLVSTLKTLVELGIVDAVASRSVVTCPDCENLAATLIVECPECESTKMTKKEALEHFDCGNIEFRSKFDKGEGIQICPKCGKKLKVIGVDYRKIENWYKCSNGHFFGQPNFKFVCTKCKGRFAIEETRVDTLYKYKLTKTGKQLLNLGVKATQIKAKT